MLLKSASDTGMIDSEAILPARNIVVEGGCGKGLQKYTQILRDSVV